MILSYLILGHLLGDFMFQPKKLVKWKMKSKKGLFIHSLIHFIVTALILLPFLINGYIWLLIVIFAISFFHFFIDATKVNYGLKHNGNGKVKLFILDQIFHLLIILVAYLVISDISLSLPNTLFYEAYTNPKVIILAYIIAFIIKRPSSHY